MQNDTKIEFTFKKKSLFRYYLFFIIQKILTNKENREARFSLKKELFYVTLCIISQFRYNVVYSTNCLRTVHVQ